MSQPTGAISSGSSLFPQAVKPPQVPIYCTADDVANILGFPANYFNATTNPSVTVVNNLICQAQDTIDELTGHAWRLRTSAVEYHELARLGRRTSWFLWPGYEIFLNHRKVQPFNSFSTTLTSQLTSGTQYSSLPVVALAYPVNAGAEVFLNWGSVTPQVVTVSANTAAGAVNLPVSAFTAQTTFPSSTLVLTFSPNVGDAFQVMVNYNQWQDWTVTMDVQWWADWNNGMVMNYYTYLGDRQFTTRFIYRYGEVDANLNPIVPGDIRRACWLRVALWLLTGAEKWNLLPQNASNIINAALKHDEWLAEFDAIIQRHSEFASPH